MSEENFPHFDVVVVGAGAGGICAALASARTGARTLLIEKAGQIGGTGVHSPVALVCKFHGTDHRPVNIGIHAELFPEIYPFSTRDKRPSAKRLTYDDKLLYKRYVDLTKAEPLLTVWTGNGIDRVDIKERNLIGVNLEDGRFVRGTVFVDATADAVLSRFAGMRTMKGRESDGQMQSATLTFTVDCIDNSRLIDPDFSTRGGMDSLLSEINAIYKAAKRSGSVRNPKPSVVAFPYPDGKRLLFNSNEVIGVDPTVPGSVESARELARELVDELFELLKQHPAFAKAKICHVSPKMGVREGPRVLGDYVLTQDDCLGEARFDDMVAACAYEVDIHDPDGKKDALMIDIPGSGYYHIPYRCLIARDADNLLVASRCMSSTHEAHSSFRVISGVTAIGQAAGTAAALASRTSPCAVRKIPATAIRFELRQQAQFVEGPVEKFPD